MSNGQYPGPLHGRRTQRKNYRYFFDDKHHKAGYSEDAQWLPEMTHDEEFAVFDLADSHDLSNEKGDLYGLRLGPEGRILALGRREEQVAEFPVAQEGHPWHGYPAWPIMRLDRDKKERKYPAPRESLAKMKEAGLISDEAAKAAGRGQTGMMRIDKSWYIAPCDVSWVGECPWTKTLCFGDEDGRLFFIESPASSEVADGNVISLKADNPFLIATDTINDVAFAGDLFAVSSRNEVVVGMRQGPLVADLKQYKHPFIGGAHGVAASRSGAFLAPIADQGLLILKVVGDQLDTRIGSHPGVPFNFYRLVRLGSGLDNEAFAAAGRRDGLMAVDFAHGSTSGQMLHHRFKGHDIVDVCPLNDPGFPLAAACVSLDRVIFLLRNVLEEQTPTTLNLANLQGTAYTLLSAHGHLFLLTDRELVVIPNMASRVLQGEVPGRYLEVSIIPVDAAEAFLVDNKSILLLEEDRIVSMFEISELVGSQAEDHVDAGSMSNGLAQLGSRVEVPRDPRQVPLTPIESGWEPITKTVRLTNPAA